MDEFDNGQPYCAIAGEVLAGALALFELVVRARPEVRQLGGALHVTVDARAGTILVGLQHEPSTGIVLIERILADPNMPATFGASELFDCRAATTH